MNPYRKKLLRISNELTSAELSDLKFVCKEHIPTGILETIQRPLELFDELEKLSLLGPENEEFLSALLTGIKRLELRDQLCGKGRTPPRDHTLLTIQESLQDHYKNVIGWLQPLTWNDSFRIHIKQIYTNLELITQTRQGASPVSRKPMNSYEEIFKPNIGQSKPSRRILIEGKAGVGKSTLVSEMVYDWATFENLASFTMVFFIELKHVERGIKEAMFDLLFPKDFPINAEKLYEYVQQHQEDVLFILDGYDEVKPTKIPDLHDLVSKKILRNATVVVTSRPNKGSKLHWFMDLRIEVTGFTLENIHQFIYKYFQDDPDNAKSLIHDLDMHPVAENIAKIPLTALLICAMWEEMPHTLILSTMTALFVELTLSLVKRYYAKESREYECDPEDLSCLDDIPQDLFQSLLQLGEVAMDGLVNDQLIFDRKSLEKKCSHEGIFELGFLSHEKSSSRLKPVQKCRFLHRSYQEFLAALWLSDRIKKALVDSSVYEETLVHVMRCISSNKLAVLFSFTPGLLGEFFEDFFHVVIKEGEVIANSEELEQTVTHLCIQALFESQQKHLAGILSQRVNQGTVRITDAIELTPYGIRALAFFIQHSSDVRALVFEDCFFSKRLLVTLARCLGDMKSLKELHFVKSFAASDAMDVFVRNLSHELSLEKLLALRSKLLGKDFAHVIKCCPHLKTLEMTDNELAKNADSILSILTALKSVPSLKELSITREKFYPNCVELFCKLLRHSRFLGNITLARIDFSDLQGLLSVVRVLQECSSRLQHVSLSSATVRKKSFGEHQAIYASLDDFLSRLSNLKHLDLSRNKLAEWKGMEKSISHLTNLQYLNLSGNAIGNTGVAMLTRSLVHVVDLEVLLLAWTGITCEGAITLSSGLKSLTKLQTLSLKSNKIADDGAMAVFEALSHVPTIQKVFFAGNKITELGVKSFVSYLKQMRTLQCLNLKQNLIAESGFVAISQVIPKLPLLHQLLLGCPVIASDVVDGSDASDHFNDSSSSESSDVNQGQGRPGSGTHEEKQGPPHLHHCHMYNALSEDAFAQLMVTAHAHPSLQAVFLSPSAIPRGANVENLPMLKLWGHFED